MNKPAAWRIFRNNVWTYRSSPSTSKEEHHLWQPLFTHRQEWVCLTDEEMRQATQAMDAEPLAQGWRELIKFAKAIEAKLKEKNT